MNDGEQELGLVVFFDGTPVQCLCGHVVRGRTCLFQDNQIFKRALAEKLLTTNRGACFHGCHRPKKTAKHNLYEHKNKHPIWFKSPGDAFWPYFLPYRRSRTTSGK